MRKRANGSAVPAQVRPHGDTKDGLTPDEAAAWDACLGVHVDDVLVWGWFIACTLLRIPPERRYAHIAHMVRYYPFVPSTAPDQFTGIPSFDVHRVRLAHFQMCHVETPLARDLMQTMQRHEDAAPVTPEMIASCVLRHLDRCEPSELAALFVLLCREPGCTPLGHSVALGKMWEVPPAAVWEVLVAERDVVCAILENLSCLRCQYHATPFGVARIVLAQVERIANPEHRAIVLGHCLEHWSETLEARARQRMCAAIAHAAREGNLDVAVVMMPDAQDDAAADDHDEGDARGRFLH
ncbi:hypothetical protein HYV74_04410 [Candidatus Uhrbacteria bacterium]|nr:hypothetical protein [Candidatus Uhrbacteria bacterium]